MDLNLKILLINRILVSDGLDPVSERFYTYEHDELGNVSSYVWVHETIEEPTQLVIDAENLDYQEELLEERIKPVVNVIVDRLDSELLQYPTYETKYSVAVWTDELQNVELQKQREAVDSQIETLNEEKLQKEIELSGLQGEKIAIEESTDPTQEDTDRLNEINNVLIPELQIRIDDIPSEISDLELIKSGIVDIEIKTKPTWEEIKAEFAIYETEVETAKALRIQEELDYSSIDIDIVIVDMLGNDVEYVKGNNKHWDDVTIRSEHLKPSWSDFKVHADSLISSLNVEKQVESLDKEMDTNIFTQAASLLGTTKFESMMFFSQSWMLKRDYPELYITDGLTVFRTTTSFETIGEALDNETIIKKYYDELCKEILVVIDKYRDNEIQNFLMQKSQL